MNNFICCLADMQKVKILPPADFQDNIFAKGQNQTPLLGFTNFRNFLKISASTAMLLCSLDLQQFCGVRE